MLNGPGFFNILLVHRLCRFLPHSFFYLLLSSFVVSSKLFTLSMCHAIPKLKLVRFVDSNVKHLGCPHYVLFTCALIVLVSIVLYTSFLLATPFIERYLTCLKCFKRYVSLKPILDAYGGSYKDKYRPWTGVLLLVRMILALITSLSDSKFASIGALMCAMVILITIHCLARRIYTKWYLSVFRNNISSKPHVTWLCRYRVCRNSS